MSFGFMILSPGALIIAAGLAVLIIGIALIRRPQMPRASYVLMGLGLVLLALAAGELAYGKPEGREVVVMVDLSHSTRGAQYRDQQFLKRRVAELVGGMRHRIEYFGEGADRTVFNPPAAAAVLLFSDAQFQLPRTGPPTYIVVDPMLDNPPDAAVRQVEIRGQNLAAMVSNSSEQQRRLETPTTHPVGTGAFVVTAPLPQGGAAVSVRLNAGDDWPENDQLTIRAPPAIHSQRWWVGADAPAGYRALDPGNLPLDSAEFLLPSIVVVNNVPASAFSPIQLQRLEQYVRDLGGSLLILGGDRAFAAGGYVGTALDGLSPLASSPPTPTIHWMLLVDASGSMAGSVGGSTRFAVAQQSLAELLPHLPPEDPISIGSFAQDLRWWAVGKRAREMGALPRVNPNGPTNLEPALVRIVPESQPGMPKELLVMTDADTRIDDVAALERGLKEKQIRLHILVIGEARSSALPALEQLVRGTGGQMLTELSPQRWTEATRKIFSMIAPNRIVTEPVEVKVLNLPGRPVAPWNRTWMKKEATPLAERAMAAQWRFGAGTVAACSFAANAAEAEAVVKLIEQRPRDPRFQVTWSPGTKLQVRVDATESDGRTYLNDQKLTLEILDAQTSSRSRHSIAQTGPGRYEVTVDSPTAASFASIHHGGSILDRIALAGRYPPEFAAIGNDENALRELAVRTGGAVIDPTQTRRIRFDFPREERPLSSWLALAAALAIASGLVVWRLR